MACRYEIRDAVGGYIVAQFNECAVCMREAIYSSRIEAIACVGDWLSSEFHGRDECAAMMARRDAAIVSRANG